jgi:uncharacterized membrane protein YfcA
MVEHCGLFSLLLPAAFFVVAALFASAGHAGASGYLAVMSLAGVAPATMRPTALFINVLVASVATWRFASVGCFSWKLFAPLVIASAPCAFIGGLVTLPRSVFSWLVGGALVYAAWRLYARAPTSGPCEPGEPRWGIAIASGGAIGLLSGLIGVGGGIFLSPLLVLAGWADARRSAGVSAAFILANSVAALMATANATSAVTTQTAPWALAALVGGVCGANLGARRLAPQAICRALSIVLMVAAWKILFT